MSALMQVRCGDWLIDEQANLLQRGDEKLRVESRLMNVLTTLVDAKGAVVTKDTLIDKVWNGAAVSDHSVANAVSDLRKLLGDKAKAPLYIETVPKKGYRLVAAVEATEAATTAAANDKPWPLWAKIALAAFLAIVILFLWVDGPGR